jgi:hypothetical protein
MEDVSKKKWRASGFGWLSWLNGRFCRWKLRSTADSAVGPRFIYSIDRWEDNSPAMYMILPLAWQTLFVDILLAGVKRCNEILLRCVC